MFDLENQSMKCDPVTLGAVGVGLTLIGGLESNRLQRKSVSEQREGRRLQKKQSDIKAARTRAATIREGRIKRAQILASATTQGAGGSSGVAGGVGSLQTQVATQVGGTFQAQAMGADISSHLEAAASAQSGAATAQAVSSIGSTIFSNSERISSIFK